MNGGKRSMLLGQERGRAEITGNVQTQTACFMLIITSLIRFHRLLDAQEVAITVEIGFLTAVKLVRILQTSLKIALERLC